MRKEMKIPKIVKNFVAGFMLLIMEILFFRTISFAEEDKKDVLFISSYSESFLTVPEQIKGIQSVFNGTDVKLEIEYMDTKRIDTIENRKLFHNLLKYKLESLPPYDAVIVGDDNALQFALAYQEELFPGIPIVFLGVNDKQRAENACENPNITGIMEETSVRDNIAIAYQFNPDAKRVVAIVDSTLTGKGDQKQFKDAEEYFPSLRFGQLNVSEYTYEEFGKELEKIEDDTLLLFLSMNQDKTGRYLELQEEFDFIKEHTHVPVYRTTVGGVGDGLMGGKMISYEEMGEVAAGLVMKIFDGTPVESLPLIEETPYRYYFDYDLIEKYHIDEILIPDGAILVNKEINPLEKYHNAFIITGIVLAFLILFSIVLIADNIRRRKMQKALRESNEELTTTYEELTATEEELRCQYESIQEHAEDMEVLNQKYKIAIQSTDSAVWEFDIGTREITISENFSKIIRKDIKRKENIFNLLNEILEPDSKKLLFKECKYYLKGLKEEINVQIPVFDGEGNKIWLLVRGKAVTDTRSNIKILHGILLDNTNLKEQEEYISYFAKHDYLTRLPNRIEFMSKLTEQLENNKKGAVVILDIDNFKSINDTLGHIYGDELLKQIADRLTAIIDSHMTVARLGGDEFLVLLYDIDRYEDINCYVQKLTNAFEGAFVLEGKENFVSFSMGITRYPKDSNNMEQLIMNADTAMYRVKNSGKNNFIFYYDEMKDEMNYKIEVEQILRRAIKNDGFELFYQPQVHVKTGEIAGYEALLRLKENRTSPAEFIPVAEETGLIIEIGRWVVKEVIIQMAAWREKGCEAEMVAINFSSKQLRDHGFIKFLRENLEENKINADRLEIEITESILLEKNVHTLEFLRELKSMGLKIALDDFGTGYSSFNYLTYIPVNKIKLDKSLNDKFLELENVKVMDSIILLAHSLGLKITAEGIEEWEKYIRLKEGGCDYIQGYLFSRPIKAKDVEKLYGCNMISLVKN